MLRVYKAPSGHLYQYEEGNQPTGYVLAEPTPEPKPTPAKARTPRNKARKTATK